MNSSHYSYPDNRNMTGNRNNKNGTRNLTTRPMQHGADMPRMRDGMRMPTAPTMPARQDTTDVTLPGLHRTAPMSPRMGTGVTGPTPPGGLTQMPLIPPGSLAAQTPTTVESPYYTAGFLKNFIGQSMRVEFLIGTSGALVDRTGVLVEVGASYIVLRPVLADDLVMCDLYSIKFVTIYQ